MSAHLTFLLGLYPLHWLHQKQGRQSWVHRIWYCAHKRGGMFALICTYTQGNHCVHTYMHVLAHVCICHLENHNYACLCTWAWLRMHCLTAKTVSICLVQGQTHTPKHPSIASQQSQRAYALFMITHMRTCIHHLEAITVTIRLVQAQTHTLTHACIVLHQWPCAYALFMQHTYKHTCMGLHEWMWACAWYTHTNTHTHTYAHTWIVWQQ